VHHGIIDGGNQSGIPVAAGGFLFDPSFLGKPLVFCGTGGILPARIGGEESWIKHIDPGDLAVMTGGRIGKDGIHGATFSSQALDEESPTSAVQIGDPITQKKMLDFLLEARDSGLYKGITDNGAGGLSSSLGEMAELSGGVRIDLDRCPLKYEGLAPWEILVSESQERMSLAVDPGKIDEFLSLARRMDVEATVVGVFTSSGAVEVTYGDETVGYLDLAFLHDGLPKMNLRAEWVPPRTTPVDFSASKPGLRDGGPGLTKACLALLSDPNVASKEPLVRQYDHEVQAGSVIKPFVGTGSDAPSDGGVLKPRYGSRRGVTVTHGICPRYGAVDTYRMALAAVDEAMRAHVALGGDPDLAYALDNFCWPDPVESEQTPDGRYKLAQLVRACEGLKETCIAYRLPLISGKDSMKNDARLGDRVISVLPTLLVSLMGIVPDVELSMTTDFKAAGDLIFLLGSTRGEMGGSAYCRIAGREFGEAPLVRPEEAIELYRRVFRAAGRGILASCHDLSEGGLAVAAAESALGGRLGGEIDIARMPLGAPSAEEGGAGAFETERILFCETPSRFLVTVNPADRGEMEAIFDGFPCAEVGRVGPPGGPLRFRYEKETLFGLAIPEIEEAWKIGYY
jgi:phosphoribosylformylglycinamidine synthase